MSVQQVFRGFANPVDPTPAELRAWAYHPDTIPLSSMPPDWDLLVTVDVVVPKDLPEGARQALEDYAQAAPRAPREHIERQVRHG